MRYRIPIDHRRISRPWLATLPLSTSEEQVLLTLNGQYRLQKAMPYRFKLQDGESGCRGDYLLGLSLFYDTPRWVREKCTGHIPLAHCALHIKKTNYRLSRRLSMINEEAQGRIHDLYFLTKLRPEDASLKEELSSFLSRLN